MAVTTVAHLAAELNRPAAALLEQLKLAGVSKASTDDALTESDKERLLDYLRSTHGTSGVERKKITLTRKSTSEIKQADSSGKARTIQVEVRKKRTFVKRDDASAASGEPSIPEIDTEELERLEQQAQAQAELLRQQEAELAERQRLREEAELAERQAAEALARAEAQKAAEAAVAAAEEAARAAAAGEPAENPAAPAVQEPPAVIEPAKPVLRVIKAADFVDEDKQRAIDLAKRRKAAEDEASAIRAMMSAPKKSAVPPKPPEEPAKPEAGKEGIKGTIHKPAAVPGAPAAVVAKPGDKKSVKSEKLSSSWADDAAKKRGLKARNDAPAGARPGWRAPRGGRRGERSDGSVSTFVAPAEQQVQEVHVPETISVADLAHKMSVKASEVIKQLMKLGQMVTINQQLDQETAMIVVEEMGHTAFAAKLDDPDAFLEDDVEIDAKHELLPRAPVVTVMGHVDHGKTSLLDYIRTARVAAGEAGGITQHIGASHVETPRGIVTFIDTPGHAAFTSMRARGAQATDVVVLVVAADDGVMPQTIEAIKHAKAAGVPIIVAVNKVDKPEADPERVKQELTQHEVIPEEWGGSNMFVNVSAKVGTGIDKLLETILLQSEVLELAAPVDGLASGVVLESSVEKGRGPVATVLVKRGTLKVGDSVLAGQEFGRVRALFDENGKSVQSAGPSIPVQVLGLSGVPNAGDDLLAVESERKAREVALYRQGKFRDVKLAREAKRGGDVFQQMEEGKASQVQVLIKADVAGSAEALRDSLTKLSTDEVVVKVIASGVGGLTESDVNLAMASNARVVAFNVRADAAARSTIKDQGVDVRYYSVIYEAIDDIRAAMTGMLSPEVKENIVGLAQVKEVFRSSKFGQVAGSVVIDGYLRRNNPIRVLRDNVVIFEGALESLRRFKDDVNEVRNGTECGIAVKDYNDVRAGDQIECFERVTVERKL